MHLRFARTTHRWRGENVSTAEVEATVSNFLELQVKQYCNNKVKSIAFKEFPAIFFCVYEKYPTLDFTLF